ncbi:MAG TPA: hypothetical protein VFE58_11295, partial [Tepidisphaeraceae bacterium]|nr:hypothetical protein [Tepidisphaeraceae bacterium]
MKQWKLLVALAMCLAFIAGAVIGLGRSRLQQQNSVDILDHGPGGGPPEIHLSEELNLSSQQRQQMRDIWESLMQDGPRLDQQRWDLEKNYRDEAQSLLTPDQKQKYDSIQAEYQQASKKLDTERHQNFTAAVEKTKALLTPDQRQKYDQILARHHGPDDPGGPGNGPGGGPPHGFGGPHPDHDSPDLLGAEIHEG